MANWRKGKTVLECNRYILENEISCDVTFYVGLEDGHSQFIRAHKKHLAARSEVFDAMFKDGFWEKDGTIRIPDISPEVFQDLLEYVYYDFIELSPDRIAQQMYAAEKYLLSDLVSQCEQWLADNMVTENLFITLECAEMFQRKRLAAKVRRYILRNGNEVLKAPSFIRLSETLLKDIISEDELRAQEDIVYEACLRWAENQCLENGIAVTGPALRQILEDCLQLIRFPLMKPCLFVDLMERWPDVLTKDEEISVLRYFISEAFTVFSTRPRRETDITYMERFTAVRYRVEIL